MQMSVLSSRPFQEMEPVGSALIYGREMAANWPKRRWMLWDALGCSGMLWDADQNIKEETEEEEEEEGGGGGGEGGRGEGGGGGG